MKAYKIAFAAVVALGITSLSGLAMRVTLAGVLLAVPGLPLGILIGFLSRSDSFLVLPLSTFLTYVLLVFAIISMHAQKVTASTWRNWTLGLLLPVAVRLILACIPTLDPMLPRGMAALRRKESMLSSEIHAGDTLAQASDILRSRDIVFTDESIPAETTVFSRGDITVRASAGDRVLFNYFDGDAYQFPCSYHLQIVLVFGRDEKLKQHYIGESRLCP